MTAPARLHDHVAMRSGRRRANGTGDEIRHGATLDSIASVRVVSWAVGVALEIAPPSRAALSRDRWLRA